MYRLLGAAAACWWSCRRVLLCCETQTVWMGAPCALPWNKTKAMGRAGLEYLPAEAACRAARRRVRPLTPFPVVWEKSAAPAGRSCRQVWMGRHGHASWRLLKAGFRPQPRQPLDKLPPQVTAQAGSVPVSLFPCGLRGALRESGPPASRRSGTVRHRCIRHLVLASVSNRSITNRRIGPLPPLRMIT